MFVTATATSHDAVDPTKLEDTSEFSAPKKVRYA